MNRRQAAPDSPSGTAGLQPLTLTERDDARWDALVAASPQGNVFLRSDWLRMMCDTDYRGLRVMRIGCGDNGDRLMAGWAIPYREHWGRFFANGFEFFYNGPVLDPALCSPTVHRINERHEALSSLAQRARAHADIVVSEAHPCFQDARAFLYDGWIVSAEYTHLWDLTETDAILQRMNREKRREIRRGLEDYEFSREEHDERVFSAFMGLYRATMRKFGWSPPPEWECQIRARLLWIRSHDGCRLYAARTRSGQIKAAVLVLLSPEDQTAYLWRMGYDSESRDSRIVPALYWWTANDLARASSSLRYVNFGGSPPRSLSLFKDYLGATATLHFRLIHKGGSLRSHLWNLRQKTLEMARHVLAQHPRVLGAARLLSARR